MESTEFIMRPNIATTVLSLIAVAAIVTPALGQTQIHIPAKAINSKTTIVGYVNFDAMTADKLKATAHAFTAGIPNKTDKTQKQLNTSIDKGMSQFDKMKSTISEAGVHGTLFGFIPPPAPPEHGKTRQFTLIRGDDSTTADKITKAMQDLPHKQGTQIEHYTGHWFAVKNTTYQMPEKGGDEQTAQRFQKLLNNSEGAVRIAILNNDNMRKGLASTKGHAGQLTALIGPIQKMQTGTLIFEPGKAPSLTFHLNFKDAQAASEAKGALAVLLASGKMMLESQLQNMAQQIDKAPKPAVIESLFNELSPRVKSNTLSIHLGKSFAQNLGKLASDVAPMLKMMFQSYTGGDMKRGGGQQD